MSVHAVIMAGGSGTRLWPLSRSRFPKFLLGRPKSLLQQTVERLRGIVPLERCRIVCGKDHAAPILKTVRSLSRKHLIIEPAARSTAACIGLAAIRILKEDPDAVLTVLPADHFIGEPEKFRKTLRGAANFAASQEVIVTVGIRPTGPHTGYGYIESIAPRTGKAGCFSANSGERPSSPEPPSQGPSIFAKCGDVTEKESKSRSMRPTKVLRFVEKPDLETARRYLRSGRHYWNGGIFVGKASVFLTEFRRWMPDHYSALIKIAEGGDLQKIYPAMKNESIDTGIMEKSDRLWVLPGDFDWRDIGDLCEWAALDGRHVQGNLIRGKGLCLDSKRTILEGDGRLLVALGVQDLIVVATGDAILVANRHRAQEVKKVVQALHQKGWIRYL